MVKLGAHMSIAGGFHRAVERAAEAGCDCVQIFTTSPRIWPRGDDSAAGGLAATEVTAFQEALVSCRISHPLAHASYLINLASPQRELWERSRIALIAELRRCGALGIRYLVLHPGAYISGPEAAGLDRIITALDEALAAAGPDAADCLLETTAGQGTSLGHRFEQLAVLLRGVADGPRVGVCFDTCHVFAAGYPLAPRRAYLNTMRQFDRTVGLENLRAFHLNDSQRTLGSRVDRHEHIGRGELGLEPFRHLLQDPRFRDLPMYLETPKGQQGSLDWDVKNLRRLRRLLPEPCSRRRAKG